MGVLGEWSFSGGLMPHGFCYQWRPALIWLHAISDTLIALAYFSIPVGLLYFVRKRRDLPFGWMFVCFGAFIAACGATHVMDVWTLWIPSYWFSGAVKVVTVLASVPTAIFLVRVVPSALSLPGPDEMRKTIEQLEQQKAILQASEERFQRMAANIQEIFWMVDPETKRATYASPAFEQICEVPLDSLYASPTSYVELIHPEDRERVVTALEQLGMTNRLDEEFRIVCPSEKTKWLRAIGCAVRDATGKVLTLVGSSQEITARKEMEIHLRENEDRYRDLVENSSDLICTYDLQGRLLSLNELPAKLLGYTREELLNMPLRNIVIPEARAQFDESLLAIQRDGFVKGTMVVITKTGERRIWEYHNTLRTEGVAAPIVRGMAHDITDRKHLEWALRLSEEKFSKAFRCSPSTISICALKEGFFLEVNESFERQTGYTRQELLGRTALEVGLWVNPSEREAILHDAEQQGHAWDREVQLRVKSGEIAIFQISVELLDLRGKQCLLTVGQDVTERKRAEEDLRRISGQLLRSQDEERRRIAQNLHDSTGQNLVALATMIGQLGRPGMLEARRSRRLLSESKVLADRCIRDVRTLSYTLYPAALDGIGLLGAIRDYVKGFMKRSGIHVDLEVSPSLGRMGQEIEVALFRVVQEALTNIQRHSGSQKARLRIERDSNLTLEISDCGRGVMSNKLAQAGRHFEFGVGISSMEERVKMLGGRLNIDSNGKGTKLLVTIPLEGAVPLKKCAP